MGIPVLIIGESGSGKTFALKNLDPETTLLVQADKKPLPFSNNWKMRHEQQGSILVSDNWEFLITVIQNAHKRNIERVILDDFQYILANEFMRRSSEKGYQKFTDIGYHTWQIIKAAQNTNCNTRFYFLMHSETISETGFVKAKTIGKMLDDKITLEGLFTIVLRSIVIDRQHYFSTLNNGFDTVKTPQGLFNTDKIENDLSIVDKSICDYYKLNN